MRRYQSRGGAAPFTTVERVYNGEPTGDFPNLPTPADIRQLRPRPNDAPIIDRSSPDDAMYEHIADILARRFERAVVPGYDGLRLPKFQTIGFALFGGDVNLALPEPTSKRVYLRIGIRTGVDAGGSVFVGFDNFNNPSLTFNQPGTGISFVEWIYTVPQNAIFLRNQPTEIDPVNVYVTYAELDPRAANDLRDHSTQRTRR